MEEGEQCNICEYGCNIVAEYENDKWVTVLGYVSISIVGSDVERIFTAGLIQMHNRAKKITKIP